MDTEEGLRGKRADLPGFEGAQLAATMSVHGETISVDDVVWFAGEPGRVAACASEGGAQPGAQSTEHGAWSLEHAEPAEHGARSLEPGARGVRGARSTEPEPKADPYTSS